MNDEAKLEIRRREARKELPQGRVIVFVPAKVFPLPSRFRRPFIPVSNRLRTTRTPSTTVSAAFKRAAFPGIP